MGWLSACRAKTAAFPAREQAGTMSKLDNQPYIDKSASGRIERHAARVLYGLMLPAGEKRAERRDRFENEG